MNLKKEIRRTFQESASDAPLRFHIETVLNKKFDDMIDSLEENLDIKDIVDRKRLRQRIEEIMFSEIQKDWLKR